MTERLLDFTEAEEPADPAEAEWEQFKTKYRKEIAAEIDRWDRGTGDRIRTELHWIRMPGHLELADEKDWEHFAGYAVSEGLVWICPDSGGIEAYPLHRIVTVHLQPGRPTHMSFDLMPSEKLPGFVPTER